ncbi:MAG TPA: hypothetical protein DCE76_03300 [Anaerolineaceae bacterium]|nr:hypothetical protein [Anaerolineaceae bacterium]
MSEAYWFGSLRLETPADLSDVLKGVGFQPGWIEEIHWIGSTSNSNQNALPQSAQFEWLHLSHPLRLLHLLLNELIHAQHHTLLWLEPDQQGRFTAVILGSPTTVGRYNAPPQYRLLPLPSATGKWDEMLVFWQTYLLQQEESPSSPGWVVHPTDANAAVQAVFPQSQRVIPPPSTSLITSLAAGLEASRSVSASAGLWIDENPPHLAIFIERR